jgi:hypothetical protein
MSLFERCPSCAQPTIADVLYIKGTCVTISQSCAFCDHQRVWSSQPYIGAIPAGNLELSCALLFSGSLPTKTIRMLQFLNMATISYRTFMDHQKYYLHPSIMAVWKAQQEQYFISVQESGQAVYLGGDGRADTPGHSAKFGSYAVMDLEKNMVVDIQLVQVVYTHIYYILLM